MDIKSKLKNSKAVSTAYYTSKSLRLRLALRSDKISVDILSSFTHHELYCLKTYGKDKFNRYADIVHNCALKNISSKDTVKVGFVVYSAAMWSCSKLYDFFENDSRFEPSIIVCSMKTQTRQAEEEAYNQAVDFFTAKGYRTIGAADKTNSINECGNPDILIYLTPYTSLLTPTCFNIANIPLDRLTVYIPYSIIVSGNEKLLKNPTINLAWKFFCESKVYLELMREHSEFGGNNTVYTGFPGLDVTHNTETGDPIFKGTAKKKIIYAPHFSIGNEGIGFSTFDKNYSFMLDLAKATADSVSWVIKPHPRLKTECVKYGLFKNEQEFDNYIAEWDSLPNAKSVFGGDYNKLFAQSDAMILDSASFTVEYQFTGNPLLFLTNERQKFNAFGKAVLNTAYKADGSDTDAISRFVYETVINSADSMKAIRKEFYDTTLNHIEHNGGLTASEKIYSIIRDEVCNGSNH